MSDPFKPTEEQKADVAEAIKYWRNILFLSHYRITPMFDPYNDEDPDTRASCNPNSIYKFANITFMPKFFTDDKDGQENSVVHELLHIVVEPLAVLYRYLLDGKLVTRQQYRDAMEEVVVQLTTAIQKLEEERQSEISALRAEVEKLKQASDQTAPPHPALGDLPRL